MKNEEHPVPISQDIDRQYADIIDLPHHVSASHPQMSMWNRAAQFAPFAALNGFDEAIRETEQKSVAP